jgi:type I restriction enzyme M protein
MSNPSSQLVSKLWNDCSILRDDGLSYGDCVEQLVLPEGWGHRRDGQF